MTAAIASANRLSVMSKLAFGFGSVAFGIKDQGFSMFLMLYYNQVLGLPAQWVGLAIAVALFADAFIDPVIGYLSDHWRSPLGRRHPFLYASALPVAVSYVFLWNPPAGLSHLQLTMYLIGLAIVVRTFVSVYEVPSAALIAELTSDYNERTSIVSYRFFFGWLGSMAMSVLALSVFMRPDATHPVGQLNPSGYASYSIAASIFMFAAILLSALGTQRHVQRVAIAPPARVPFDLKRSLGEVKATFTNRGVRQIFGAGLFGGMAGGIGMSLYSYINTYFWELTADQISVLTTSGIISAFLGVVLATRLSVRFGKRNTAVGMHLIAFLVVPAPAVLRLMGLFPANGSAAIIPILYMVGIVGAACSIVGSILWYSMTADVVEDSQLATGRRSEGLLFSANAFVLKCVSGVGLGVGGFILSLVGFPERAQPGGVAQGVLDRLMIVDLSLVGVFYVLAIACLAAFPISKATHQANLRRLGQDVPEEPSDSTQGPATPTPSAAGTAIAS